MKNTVKTLLLFAPLFMITSQLMAQGGAPVTPLDGGLSLLLAAGAGYGIKRMIKSEN